MVLVTPRALVALLPLEALPAQPPLAHHALRLGLLGQQLLLQVRDDGLRHAVEQARRLEQPLIALHVLAPEVLQFFPMQWSDLIIQIAEAHSSVCTRLDVHLPYAATFHIEWE